jgi:hypothetical protein
MQANASTSLAGSFYEKHKTKVRGDICAAECMVNGEKVLIVTFYLSSNTPIDGCKRFVPIHLGTCAPKSSEEYYKFLVIRMEYVNEN